MRVGCVWVRDEVLSDDDGVRLDSILHEKFCEAISEKCEGEEIYTECSVWP